jgi:hypothetical protein
VASDTYTVHIEVGDSTDEFELPVDALDMLAEDGETPADVLGDLGLLSLAQQLHGAVHHGHGEADDALEAAEADVMDAFEERFGQSFAEMTGHDH